MITAQEAHELSKKNNASARILKRAEKEIKTAAIEEGKFDIVFDCESDSHYVIAEVANQLRAAGYKLVYVPGISTMGIRW